MSLVGTVVISRVSREDDTRMISYPWRTLQTPPPPSHSCTIQQAPSYWLAEYHHLGTEEAMDAALKARPPAYRHSARLAGNPHYHYQHQRMALEDRKILGSRDTLWMLSEKKVIVDGNGNVNVAVPAVDAQESCQLDWWLI